MKRERRSQQEESKTVYLSKTQVNLKLMNGKEIAPISRPEAGGGAHLGNKLRELACKARLFHRQHLRYWAWWGTPVILAL